MGRVIGYRFLVFITLNILCQSLLGCESICWEIIGQSYERYFVANCFCLTAFRILYLFLTFGILIMMCLGVGLKVYLVWDSLNFLNLYVYFLHHIREVFYQYFFNSLFFLFSFFTPIVQMLVCLKLNQRPLTLSSFGEGEILFSFSLLFGYFLLPYIPNSWFDSLLHLIYVDSL